MRIVKCTGTRENQLHYNTDLQKLKQGQRLGLTVAFARDLAKHVTLDFHFLMILSTSCVSLPQEIGHHSTQLAQWARLRYLHRWSPVRDFVFLGLVLFDASRRAGVPDKSNTKSHKLSAGIASNIGQARQMFDRCIQLLGEVMQ